MRSRHRVLQTVSIINNLDEIKNLIYNGKEFKFVDDSFINHIKKPYIKNTIQPFKIYFGNNKIIFPTDIVQYVYDLSSDKSEDGFKCIYGGTEMFIPKSLPKKKKKTKEYTM